MTTESTSQTPPAEAAPDASPDHQEATSPESPLAALEVQLKAAEQKYVYLYAEFENFKRRAQKEREEAVKYGWEKASYDFLEVIDNLDRALHFAGTNTDKNLLMGLKMVSDQFRAALEKQGVQPIDTAGQKFDPHLHEAVGEAESELPKGGIVREETKGYRIHGRLLRASRVIVSKGNEKEV